LHSEAEARLLHALLSKGLDVKSKKIVRGYECDFVVEGQRGIVNIECDGRHHINEAGKLRLRDQARDELIRHQGWKVIRIPSWRCFEQPEQVAAEIAVTMGLRPQIATLKSLGVKIGC
jgi:very-short-patch-repair endonuclease